MLNKIHRVSASAYLTCSRGTLWYLMQNPKVPGNTGLKTLLLTLATLCSHFEVPKTLTFTRTMLDTKTANGLIMTFK